MKRLVRFVLVLAAAASIVGIEIYLQNDAVRECIDRSIHVPECMDQHRNIGRALGLGGIAALILLPVIASDLPESARAFINRIHRPFIVSPDNPRDRKRVVIATTVAATGVVVVVFAGMLWMAVEPKDSIAAWILGTATVLGAVALVVGVVDYARWVIHIRQTQDER